MAEGVAEYADEGLEPYRILIGENTLKTMDSTYAGKPLYVEHVDEVDLDRVEAESAGYVVESFFNKLDGKHWAKFIVVSDAGHEAIRRGWKLSNSYVPQSFTQGGLWHGVQYAKEITNGEYEHLAIVPNPRYEESIIMTPEEFKRYNDEKKAELERVTNSKEKEKKQMGLKWFKKAKVENSIDVDMSVVLPKSGKEITVAKMVELADAAVAKKKNSLADPSDKVKMHDGNMCNVGELLDKHKALHDELEAMKAKHDAAEKEGDVEVDEEAVDVEGDDKSKDNDDPSEADDAGAIEKDKKNDDEAMDNDDEESMDNEDKDKDKKDNDDAEDGAMDNDGEDEDAKKKALQLAEHEEKEIVAAKKKKNAADTELAKVLAKHGKKKTPAATVTDLKNAADKKKAAKEKADKLRNAHLNFEAEETAVVEIMADGVMRGKSLYGSN